MAVFRVERNSGYTVMSNHHLRNKELTLKAKGLLSQMLSLPEDWDYTLAGLSHINRESIDAIRTAVLSSLSPNNFVNQWGESDFALTYSISEEGNLLSDEMLQQIATMQGIENLRVTYSASPWPTMDVIYDENVFGKYIDSLDGVSGLDFSNAETRKNYTDNFWSGVYGIDSRYIEELNKTLDKPIDLTAFEKGELVVLSAMTDDEGNPLIQPGQAITVVGESGEQVFTVATGFLDADFQSGRGNERGTAPDLYISEQALEKLSGETKILRIAFDTIDSSYDKGIMEQLQSITASSPGITILSRYEKQQEMAGYLLTSRIIAAGLSAVFLLIGIMNFINTMVVSVNTRKHEFATLESIGMTKKQITCPSNSSGSAASCFSCARYCFQPGVRVVLPLTVNTAPPHSSMTTVSA